MGNVENAVARAAIFAIEQALNVKRLTLDPTLEGGRSEDVVELHGEIEAVILREEGFEVENAEFFKGGVLRLQNQFAEVEVAVSAPGIFKDIGKEDVFTRAHGVNVFQTDKAKKGGDGACNFLADNFFVALPRNFGSTQRGEDVDRDACIGAGGVDGEMGGIAEGLEAFFTNAPFFQPGGPGAGGIGGSFFDAFTRATRFVWIDPGLEVGGEQVGEVEEGVGDVAFRVDHEGGDVVEGGFFEQVDAEAGLARACHADDDGVGGEVGGIVEQGFFGFEIFAKKELSVGFEHGCTSELVGDTQGVETPCPVYIINNMNVCSEFDYSICGGRGWGILGLKILRDVRVRSFTESQMNADIFYCCVETVSKPPHKIAMIKINNQINHALLDT